MSYIDTYDVLKSKKHKCFVNREMLLSYIMACGSQCHQRQYRRQGTKLDRYWGITKHRKERSLRGRMLLVTLQHGSPYLACSDRNAFFTSEKPKKYHAWSCQNVCDALTFLLDNIFI